MKKTIMICDNCGNEIGADGASLRLNYSDARRGAKAADLCGECAGNIPGHAVNRRGRPPKDAS